MQLQAASALSRQSKDNYALDQITETIATAQELTQEALEDVRQSVSALRAPLNEGKPLPQMLTEVLENVEASGLQTEFILLGTSRPLPSEAEWALYRAAQEGLQNTSKHARATRFQLTLDYSDPGQVRMLMEDDGIGTEQVETGFGLLGIQERLNLMQGQTNITTDLGKGFKIEVTIPG
jgi:signal transduction histidine kinase